MQSEQEAHERSAHETCSILRENQTSPAKHRVFFDQQKKQCDGMSWIGKIYPNLLDKTLICGSFTVN
jgi:hypothetical protein